MPCGPLVRNESGSCIQLKRTCFSWQVLKGLAASLNIYPSRTAAASSERPKHEAGSGSDTECDSEAENAWYAQAASEEVLEEMDGPLFAAVLQAQVGDKVPPATKSKDKKVQKQDLEDEKAVDPPWRKPPGKEEVKQEDAEAEAAVLRQEEEQWWSTHRAEPVRGHATKAGDGAYWETCHLLFFICFTFWGMGRLWKSKSPISQTLFLFWVCTFRNSLAPEGSMSAWFAISIEAGVANVKSSGGRTLGTNEAIGESKEQKCRKEVFGSCCEVETLRPFGTHVHWTITVTFPRCVLTFFFVQPWVSY